MSIATPKDPAVEYGIVLSSGDVFYTGGFDEIPTPGSLITSEISGTFDAEDPDAKWHITWLDFSRVVAIIDYRKEDS